MIDDALSALEPDARGRIMSWANQKYSGAATTPPTPSPSAGVSSTQPRAKKAKSSSAKKPKSIVKVDKDINLFPGDRQTSVEFAVAKAPTNAKEKGVVAIYYVRDILEYPIVTTSQVAAFFKAVGWPMPTDLSNVLQQAGSAGWLDTSDSDDLKITSVGENLVEHNLPKVKAT